MCENETNRNEFEDPSSPTDKESSAFHAKRSYVVPCPAKVCFAIALYLSVCLLSPYGSSPIYMYNQLQKIRVFEKKKKQGILLKLCPLLCVSVCVYACLLGLLLGNHFGRCLHQFNQHALSGIRQARVGFGFGVNKHHVVTSGTGTNTTWRKAYSLGR